VGESRDTNNIGMGGERLTIAEAAALLGVHKNTVRNRIKNGSYRAEMVQTERGPTYLIERESLLTNLSANTLSGTSQELGGHGGRQFVEELLRPFVSELGEIREQMGAERARRQMAEERSAALGRELEVLREARESPEMVEEEPESSESLTPLREGLRRGSRGPGGGGCSVAELLRSLIRRTFAHRPSREFANTALPR
jgi:excisionase family DNA binding protein